VVKKIFQNYFILKKTCKNTLKTASKLAKIRENPLNPRLKPSKSRKNFSFFAKNLRLFNIQNRFLCPKPPFSLNFVEKNFEKMRKFSKNDFFNLQFL